jgi:phytoene synthase
VGSRDLDAAGITDPGLRAAYTQCRRLNAAHGRTFYLATLLLPPARRPFVHALYGFARWADEVVDDLGSTATVPQKAAVLAQLRRSVHGVHGGPPLVGALRHTLQHWSIPVGLVEEFLDSMELDLSTRSYATFEDLMGYVHGSAAVIGLQMLPLLQPTPGLEHVARSCAADLGVGFQLVNFIRDISEDLLRDRVYLPQESLDAFGVTRELLRAGEVTRPVRELLEHEIARARSYLQRGQVGIRLVHPSSRPCLQSAVTPKASSDSWGR